jgi:hypothetical protein
MSEVTPSGVLVGLGELGVSVLVPGAPGFAEAARPALAQYEGVKPQVVVRAASAEDVSRTLRFARERRMRVVPRGGGHCFAGRSSTDGILLDLGGLDSVSVSVSKDGLATVGAGVRLGPLYDALDERGWTLPAGCGATVGIAGLTLGGGLGLLGRRYGTTSDRLRAAEVVLTDGRIVQCDEEREPELFWALRGAGGGQFGVVTSLVFDAVPSLDATRIVLTWPAGSAAAVISAWQVWAPDAPDELNVSLKVTATGTDGPQQIVLFGAMLGAEHQTAALMEEFVRLAGVAPASQSLALLPYRVLKGSLDDLGQGTDDVPALMTSKSGFFRRSLPAEAIDELLSGLDADRRPGQHRELNFTPMGGAYNRVKADATAFVHRSERFMVEHVVLHDGTTTDWVRRSWSRLQPWASGRVYPNFPDPELVDWAEAYHGGNHPRLVRVKQSYDPDRLLDFPQSV